MSSLDTIDLWQTRNNAGLVKGLEDFMKQQGISIETLRKLSALFLEEHMEICEKFMETLLRVKLFVWVFWSDAGFMNDFFGRFNFKGKWNRIFDLDAFWMLPTLQIKKNSQIMFLLEFHTPISYSNEFVNCTRSFTEGFNRISFELLF